MAKDVVFDGVELDVTINIDGGELGVFYNNGEGTSDYPSLANKPKINGVVVLGDKEGADYRLQDKMTVATIAEIEAILYLD